jgi:uncharacterized membrane protein YhaH (DUF805 family)
MNLWALLFSFRGRLNRGPYWLAWIAGGLVSLILSVVLFVIIGKSAIVVFLVLAFVPGTWISLALMIKRLHDRDKSAWWLSLFYLVPLVLQAIGQFLGSAGLILDLIATGIGIWAIIELGFLRGTDGPNKFGPDPLLAQAPS